MDFWAPRWAYTLSNVHRISTYHLELSQSNSYDDMNVRAGFILRVWDTFLTLSNFRTQNGIGSQGFFAADEAEFERILQYEKKAIWTVIVFGIIGNETHRKLTADIVKSESEGLGDKKESILYG